METTWIVKVRHSYRGLVTWKVTAETEQKADEVGRWYLRTHLEGKNPGEQYRFIGVEPESVASWDRDIGAGQVNPDVVVKAPTLAEPPKRRGRPPKKKEAEPATV